MALRGSILSTTEIGGTPLGSILSTTLVDGVALGGILSTTDVTTGGGASPATFTSGHPYVVGRDGWMYVPEGYEDNLDNYPLIIFGHGYGQRSSNVNDVLEEGCPYYLNQGDRPPGVLIFCPQIPSGDYTLADWDAALDYVTTNYRVDTNRVYATGLSGGGFMARDAAKDRPEDVAAVVVVAANMDTGWVWSEQVDIGHYWVHGTADTNQTNGMQSLLNSANATTRTVPFLTLPLWGLNHTGTVWNTNCYNRKNRTDAVGTALFDYIDYLKKHSKDPTQRATLHVEYAEDTELIEDYREAVKHVAALSAGDTKTALEARLATLKSTIKNGGRFFVLDFGATAPGMANITQVTTATTGTTTSNIVDDEGGASVIDFQIVSQFASAPASRMNDIARANGGYFGFEPGVYRDGLRIEGAITTGQCKFSSLNASKTYKIRIYHTFGSGNFTDESEISATIGGVTKSQYSECNNTLYLEWVGLTPNGSNEIVIDIDPSGTNSRNTQVCAIELYESA